MASLPIDILVEIALTKAPTNAQLWLNMCLSFPNLGRYSIKPNIQNLIKRRFTREVMYTTYYTGDEPTILMKYIAHNLTKIDITHKPAKPAKSTQPGIIYNIVPDEFYGLFPSNIKIIAEPDSSLGEHIRLSYTYPDTMDNKMCGAHKGISYYIFKTGHKEIINEDTFCTAQEKLKIIYRCVNDYVSIHLSDKYIDMLSDLGFPPIETLDYEDLMSKLIKLRNITRFIRP